MRKGLGGNGLQTGKAHMLSFNLVEKATVNNVNYISKLEIA